ncbi:hypothetical protein EXS66_00630 [Candidatus Saccharibacteria bacterium]|nr:hypothetical protein [Candidatus Saccharibacteria bacterium]
MSTAAMSLRKNQNIVRNKIKIQSGPITAVLMLVMLVVLLGLMYLNQVTKTSTFNYKISNLERKQSGLQVTKDNLSIDAARLQSIAVAKQAAESAKLEPIKTVSYTTAR